MCLHGLKGFPLAGFSLFQTNEYLRSFVNRQLKASTNCVVSRMQDQYGVSFNFHGSIELPESSKGTGMTDINS